MWRYLVGGAAGVLAVVAGMMLQAMRTPATAPPPLVASARAGGQDQVSAAEEPAVPEALAKTREQKRFDRYDKDRDGSVTRTEYLLSRHKAFAKLDRNGDGTLSFDEWAAKTETKFATADKDASGALTRAEFATTAVKRKPHPRPACADKPAPASATEEAAEES